jgi:hypothetical protein
MHGLTMASEIPAFGEVFPAINALQLQTSIVFLGMASTFVSERLANKK